MRIGLTFDLKTDPADERQAEFDPPETIAAVSDALRALGHQVVPLGSARDLVTAPWRLGEVELVFNLAEGTHGRCREAWVPTLLELHGVPYVGSGPLALALALDKVACKRLARAAGIPTPRWLCVERPSALPMDIPLRFPLIVKPRHEGSGRGIDAGAVVETPAALSRRIHWLFERCRQPLVVEEFIAGGELTVCLIGNDPPHAYPAIQRPLDQATRLSCHLLTPAPSAWDAPLTLHEPLDAQAREMARGMFSLLGCRDMARVDLRVDGDGRPSVLEINPLPSFDPEGSLGLLAESLGTTYTALVGRILEAALLRLGSVRPASTSARPGSDPQSGNSATCVREG
jgi:D-alanine-D-alanine ligase